MAKKAINHYLLGSKFLEYCVKIEWLIQEGSGGRGTRWYLTEKSKKALKDEFEIKV